MHHLLNFGIVFSDTINLSNFTPWTNVLSVEDYYCCFHNDVKKLIYILVNYLVYVNIEFSIYERNVFSLI